MTKAADPAMLGSNFERNEKDRYWTEHWCTEAALRVCGDRLRELDGFVADPAAGRGDIVAVLQDNVFPTMGTDIDMSEYDQDRFGLSFEQDFLRYAFIDQFDARTFQPAAIFTNPPYDKAEKFVRGSLLLPSVQFVAMLLRSEWDSAGSRTDLFEQPGSPFAYEIVLTSRPRWDWWLPAEEIAKRKAEGRYHGPRHNFSWFVWDKGWEGRCTKFYEGKLPRAKS